ncbi:hypothetical protein BJP41_08420 [Candidatus Williamhamiltonella defendens]|uniref:Uncharacterized protein n=1 Tax=Candidatus Williamhamiltonella defendens TaxID=138072 RepID=A0A2D3T3P7_9ENTR|nr:hypothetical protein [Candidatus Hamiltonella defensa]ATW30334.1 hypothetical protein BJP41_08420 [Candidatus Hamiltonella defensa]ATW32350.1 hypothetical protein BJP42_08735 [Candidatus Hamiltonella defensa]
MVHNAIQNEHQSHKDKLALEQASKKRSEDEQKSNNRDKSHPELKDSNRNSSSSQDEPGKNSLLNGDHGNRLEASLEQNSSIKPLSSNDEIRNLLRQAKVTKGEDDNLHLELDVKIPHKNNDTNDNATLSLDVSMGQTKTVFYKNDAPPTFGSRVPETQTQDRTSATLVGLHTSTLGVGIHIENSSGSIKSALPRDSFDNFELQNHDSGQTTFISTGSFPNNNKSAPKSIKN